MNSPQIRIVLASHGEQSKGMLNTVQMLLGEQQNITAYCLYPEQSVVDFTEVLQGEINEHGAENIVFMTELRGGSPFNTVVSLTREQEVYHVTGTNLAMLIGAIMERYDANATAESVCDAAIKAAADSIVDVRRMLAESIGEEEEDL